MSISQANSQSSPATPPLVTPTTTHVVISSNAHQAPKTHTRNIGEHARMLGYDWNKRADQHKYRTGLGLPEVHAAIINEDWDTALELMGPDDLGLMWLPPCSQRAPSKGADNHSSRWASVLPTTDPDKQQQAIIEMVSDRVSTTTLDTNVIAYGANLLTLALLKPARQDVQEKIFQMALKHQSPYLRLPDGSGRIPLWLAVDKGNLACVETILKSGEVATRGCIFPGDGLNEYPLFLAATQGGREIFALCLESEFVELKCDNHYPLESDHLQIRRWVQRSSEEDVRWLAEKFPHLRHILFSLPDETGTSLLFRAIRSGSLDEISNLLTSNAQLAEGFFCFNPLIPTDPHIGPSITPLMLAATTAPVACYNALLREAEDYTNNEAKTTGQLASMKEAVRQFIVYRSGEDIAQFISKHGLTNGVLKILLNPLNVPFSDKYRDIIKAIWPTLRSGEKLKIFSHTAEKDDGRTEFVLGLLDISLDEDTLDDMMRRAAAYQNPTAFEFAAERSLGVGKILGNLATSPQSTLTQQDGVQLAVAAIRAGSLKWLDALIKAGLDFQRLERTFVHALPVLADLDPDGLSNRLRSVRYRIGDDVIQSTGTEAGRKALIALQQANAKQ
jgi:ankyrin repeat protein